MNTLQIFNSRLNRISRNVLAVLFAGLIVVVFVQVAARNVLHLPLTWTLDLAQLLFTWCIFLGAAFAFRQGGHYLVDLWPDNRRLNQILGFVTHGATAVVVYVLVWHGLLMSQIGLNRMSLSLNISEFWYYLPIPLCGLLIGLFALENLLTSIQTFGKNEETP